ncbi:DUF4174 domain-containing protein [Pseudomonas akapageensis]|uniref:DUF4174 domain-containing protein n=1 Tax=Pseudomonas akapageensis TaxID=2609961 RepID=UPI00140C3488|nr:DUF4174 domain-containing protein [Pseudomonas akapageensis]
MLIRSLTLATLLVAASPWVAADSDTPLANDRGSRPLIVIVPSSADPTLVKLKKDLEEPDNRKAFTERKMVFYTVINTVGQRDGKDLDPQTTMGLIRELKLGAGSKAKVILIGKDGEKKLEQPGPIEAKEIFSTIDALPVAEQEATRPAPPPPEETAPPANGKKDKKAKPAKPAGPPKPLDD